MPTRSPRVEYELSLLSLVRKIETELFIGCYTVFGVYQDQHCEHNCSFAINGDICGFIPSLGIRAAATERDGHLSGLEWNSDPEYLQHRSGLRFGLDSIGFASPDGSILHPATLAADIATLGAVMQVAPSLVEHSTRSAYEHLAKRLDRFKGLKDPEIFGNM